MKVYKLQPLELLLKVNTRNRFSKLSTSGEEIEYYNRPTCSQRRQEKKETRTHSTNGKHVVRRHTEAQQYLNLLHVEGSQSIIRASTLRS